MSDDGDAHILVFTTCPDGDSARAVAGHLVEAGLAACVNILPQAVSVYRWQGEVEQAAEHVLLIKTRRDRFGELERAVQARHPYELPELIAVRIATGSDAYLAWIDQLTGPGR